MEYVDQLEYADQLAAAVAATKAALEDALRKTLDHRRATSDSQHALYAVTQADIARRASLQALDRATDAMHATIGEWLEDLPPSPPPPMLPPPSPNSPSGPGGS